MTLEEQLRATMDAHGLDAISIGFCTLPSGERFPTCAVHAGGEVGQGHGIGQTMAQVLIAAINALNVKRAGIVEGDALPAMEGLGA